MPGAWLTVDAQGDLDRFHGFDLVRVGRQDATEGLGHQRILRDETVRDAVVSFIDTAVVWKTAA